MFGNTQLLCYITKGPKFGPSLPHVQTYSTLVIPSLTNVHNFTLTLHPALTKKQIIKFYIVSQPSIVTAPINATKIHYPDLNVSHASPNTNCNNY